MTRIRAAFGSGRACCLEYLDGHVDQADLEGIELLEGGGVVCPTCGTGWAYRDGAWEPTSKRAEWVD